MDTEDYEERREWYLDKIRELRSLDYEVLQCVIPESDKERLVGEFSMSGRITILYGVEVIFDKDLDHPTFVISA